MKARWRRSLKSSKRKVQEVRKKRKRTKKGGKKLMKSTRLQNMT
jgi:hypothetical protein